MQLKAKQLVSTSVYLFLALVILATLGWLLLLFVISHETEGMRKLICEVLIECLKVVVIGAAAAVGLEYFLRRSHGDTPDSLLKQVGIQSVFLSRRDQETTAEFMRAVKDGNVRKIVIAGISLRDFLLGGGILHPIWRAIQDRLQHEQASKLLSAQRLHVRVLLLQPRSDEGCFRHSVEGQNANAPGGGIPFDVPQGIGTVVATQHMVYGAGETEYLEVRLYEHCPFAFMWATDTSVLVEQYDYRNQTKDAALPLMAYRSGTSQYDELLNSLETVWQHAHPAEEMNQVGTATAIREARLRSIFRHIDRAHLSKRQADALPQKSGQAPVRIMAISGRFYTSYPGMAPLLRQLSRPTQDGRGTPIQVALVNPVSQQAILRAVADELPAKDIREHLQHWDWTKHIETSLYRDTMRTIQVLQQWIKSGSNIEIRLYSSAVACALLLTESSSFIEQYVYGRSKAFQPGLVLGGEYPVLEFEREQADGRDMTEQEVIENTFDIVWNCYSIVWDEYARRDPMREFEKNLLRLREELGMAGDQPPCNSGTSGITAANKVPEDTARKLADPQH